MKNFQLDTSHITTDELVDANECARRYIGKAIEECDRDDLQQIRDCIQQDLMFLNLQRDIAIQGIADILDEKFETVLGWCGPDEEGASGS